MSRAHTSHTSSREFRDEVEVGAPTPAASLSRGQAGRTVPAGEKITTVDAALFLERRNKSPHGRSPARRVLSHSLG